MGDNGRFDVLDVDDPVFILPVYDMTSFHCNSVLFFPGNFNQCSKPWGFFLVPR